MLLYVVGIKHLSNGFDDLLSNEITSPELTITDSGRLLDITLYSYSEASRDALLHVDVYVSNSLGHHLPGYIFSSVLPPLVFEEQQQVSLRLVIFRKCYTESIQVGASHPNVTSNDISPVYKVLFNTTSDIQARNVLNCRRLKLSDTAPALILYFLAVKCL